MRSGSRLHVYFFSLLLAISFVSGPTIFVARADAQEITGTIGFAQGGALPDYVMIRYYSDEGGISGSNTTNASLGWQWSIINLTPYPYRIWFVTYGGQYLSEWWRDAASQETATPVIVTSNSATTVDSTLNIGGFIAGTIEFAEGGVYPDSVSVSVYHAGTGTSAGSDSTDAAQNWQYGVSRLTSGDYKVRFTPSGGHHLQEWWLDASSQDMAIPLTVAEGFTTTASPTLDLGGMISGTIGFAEGGVKPSSVLVYLYRADTGASAGNDYTYASQGWQYNFGNLPPGDYKVQFNTSDGHYLSEWWLNAASQDTAIPVSLTAGSTAVVDPTLDLGGFIAGTIGFAEGGVYPDSVSVSVYHAGTGASAGSDSTDAAQNWQYSVSRLTSGDYKARFRPSGGHHLQEWWLDASSQDMAIPLTVAEGSMTMASPTLDLGGIVAGTIGFAEGGVKPSSVEVGIFRSDTGDSAGYDSTNASQGWQYNFGNLPPGDYKVRFNTSDGHYLSEWWLNAASQDTAIPMSLTAGSTATVDPTLDLGGFIAGTIGFAEGGVYPDSVSVSVYHAGTGASAGSDSTDAAQNWQYSVSRLTSGDYKVRFRTTGGGYASEWWQDTASQVIATPVRVTAGATETVNPALDLGGFISGILGFYGFGINPSQVSISVYRLDTGAHVNTVSTNTDINWSYTTDPLLPGDYLVEFESEQGTCIAEWWLDKENKETATPVTVTAGISATASPNLSLGAKISGTIGFASGGIEPERTEIDLYRADTESFAGIMSTSAAQGWQYSIVGLRDGEYKVHFQPAGGSYAAEWWNNMNSPTTAAAVAVDAGGEATTSPILDLRRGLILWSHATRGLLYAWNMLGVERAHGESVSPNMAPQGWKIAGTGDLNGDREMDILWRNSSTGSLYVWFMNGSKKVRGSKISPASMPANWSVAGTGDFDLDGNTDILWRNRKNGYLRVWYMNGSKQVRASYLTPISMLTTWTVAGLGDFNADEKTDILWRNSDGSLRVWLMDGVEKVRSLSTTPISMPKNWAVAATGDFNDDRKTDILWRNLSNGSLYVWLMDGLKKTQGTYTKPGSMPVGWTVLGYGINTIGQSRRPVSCESCHNGSVAMAPNVIRGTPGEDSVWDGSWWDSIQGGNSATQQGGHGDPDGKPAVECTGCHDTSLPSGYHLNGILESTGPSTVDGALTPQNVNENTAHLKAEFIATSGGDNVQITFDNTCSRNQLPTQTGSCHATNTVGEMRHARDFNSTLGQVTFGEHLTEANGNALPTHLPIDSDLTTIKSTTDPDYAPCISCHDPHGTRNLDTPGSKTVSSNRMMRYDWGNDNQTICRICH